MEVPAAMSDVIFLEIPIFGPNQETNPMPVAIDNATTGTPATPREIISIALNFAPTQMIPLLKIVVVENFKPGTNTSGIVTPGKLRTAMPRRMDTGIPEMGLLAPDIPW